MKRLFSWTGLMLIALSLSACVQSVSDNTLATPVQLQGATREPTPKVATQIPLPLPSMATTPVSLPANAISAANSKNVVQLWQWGKGWIHQLALSPDGRLLAVASSLGIYLYDAATLAELRLIKTSSQTRALAFSPDGQLAAVGFSSGAVQIWRTTDWSMLRQLATDGDNVNVMTFSPDGQILAVGEWYRARLWNVSDGALLQTLKRESGSVYGLAFSPDGQTLVSGSLLDKAVLLWRVRDGTLIRTFQPINSIWNVAVTPDGQIVAAASSDKTIQLWKLADGSLVRTLVGHTNKVLSMAMSPDGQTLASVSNDHTVRVWRLADGSLINKFDLDTPRFDSVVFSANGQMVFITTPHEIYQWHIADGKVINKVSGFSDLGSVALSPDKQMVAVGDYDGLATLWRVSDQMLIRSLQGHDYDVRRVIFSHDGQQLITFDYEHVVRLWRISDGALLRAEKEKSGDRGIALSPNGQMLATSAGYAIILWRLNDGAVARELSRPVQSAHGPTTEGSAANISFSPDGQILVTTSEIADEARIWSIATGKLLRQLPIKEASGVAFSPDGNVVATGSATEGIKLWRVADGQPILTLTGVEKDKIEKAVGRNRAILHVAYSPDGSLLAVGGSNRTLQLFRVPDGALVQTFDSFNGEIVGIAFSPDGQMLIAGSEDGTARIWGVR